MSLRRVAWLLAPVCALLALTGAAVAYWSAAGAGPGTARAGTLGAPGKPTATMDGTAVELAWFASSAPAAAEVRYHVERRPASDPTWSDACSSTSLAGTSCTDVPGSGSFVYRVTAHLGGWSTEGPSGDPVQTAVLLDHFDVTSASSSQTAGAAFAVTVTARTAEGAAIDGYKGTVQLGSSDAAAVLPDAYTFTGAESGTHTFPAVTLRTAGTQTLTASADGRTGQASYAVAAGPAAGLAFVQQPSDATATAAITPAVTVEAVDAHGNRSAFGGAVTISLLSGSGTLAGTTTRSAVAGLATFGDLSLDKTGSKSLRASAAGLAGDDSRAFSIGAGPLHHFAVSAPAAQTAGTPFDVSITALDAGDNAVASYTGSHSLVWSGPGSSPSLQAPSYPQSVSFSNGVGTAGVTLYRAATASLTAAEGAVSGATGSLTIAPGAPARLAWNAITSPSTGVPSPCLFTCSLTNFNNKLFSSRVAVTDAWGNVVHGFAGRTITVSRSGPGSFTAPTGGASVTLSTSATGPAVTTQEFTFKAENGSWTSASLTASSSAMPGLTSAAAALSK